MVDINLLYNTLKENILGLSIKSLRGLINLIQADINNLIGLLDAVEHFLLLESAIMKLNHDEYHIHISPHFKTAKLIKKQKIGLLIELPELNLSNVSKPEFNKLEFKTNPIYKLLHCRPSTNTNCFDYLCAHLILLNKLNTTEQKECTLADWAYDIRLITAPDKTDLLNELNSELNNHYNSVHFYKILDKLTKSPSPFREFHEELRHFMSACRDKEKHSKKSSTRKHTQERAATIKKTSGELFNKEAFSNVSEDELNDTKPLNRKHTKHSLTSNLTSNFKSDDFDTLKNDELPPNEIHNKNENRIKEKLNRHKNKKGIDNVFEFNIFQITSLSINDEEDSNFAVSTHKTTRKTGCYNIQEYERLIKFQHAAIIKNSQITSTHRDILNRYDISIFIKKIVRSLQISDKPIDIKISLALQISLLYGIKIENLNKIQVSKLNDIQNNSHAIVNIDLNPKSSDRVSSKSITTKSRLIFMHHDP